MCVVVSGTYRTHRVYLLIALSFACLADWVNEFIFKWKHAKMDCVPFNVMPLWLLFAFWQLHIPSTRYVMLSVILSLTIFDCSIYSYDMNACTHCTNDLYRIYIRIYFHRFPTFSMCIIIYVQITAIWLQPNSRLSRYIVYVDLPHCVYRLNFILDVRVCAALTHLLIFSLHISTCRCLNYLEEKHFRVEATYII